MDAASRRRLAAVFLAKTVRTACYGSLSVLLPVHLSRLGLSASEVGLAVTLTLAGSAAFTGAARRPAERFGARAVLLSLSLLSVLSAAMLLASSRPWLVVVAAVLGNVAVSTGETGPFLAIEQVLIARAAPGASRVRTLSAYNLTGYVAGGGGAALVAIFPSARTLFAVFLAGSVLQCAAYALLPPRPGAAPAGKEPIGRESRRLIRRLAALFALDAFAGGFIVQSLVAYYLHLRFGLSLPALGTVFFVCQILTAASLLFAARLAARFGLLNTMVFTHLASNLLLIAIAVAPVAWAALCLLFLRQLLSQMDVPTRQAYVMEIVADREREAAASTTTLWRTIAQAVTPALSGSVMQAVALSAPFGIGGALKIVYDLTLYATFRRVPLQPEASGSPSDQRPQIIKKT